MGAGRGRTLGSRPRPNRDHLGSTRRRSAWPNQCPSTFADHGLRAALVAKYGLGGKGGGTSYSAASKVAMVANAIVGREKDYIDTRGVLFQIDGEVVEPGYGVCAVFRLSDAMG